MLTAERLREVLKYDPETGAFTWLVDTGKRRMIGKTAGVADRDGRILISVDTEKHRAHRLAWLYVYGKWPSGIVDHIDRNVSNNSISNLRLATHAQNMANCKVRKHSRSGIKGVSRIKSGKWISRIRSGGRSVYVGCFDTAADAQAAYMKAARAIWGEFATTGDVR